MRWLLRKSRSYVGRHGIQQERVTGKKLGKKLNVHDTPWQFSETPAKPGIAPELGEHNEAALAGIGCGKQQSADLKAGKIIRCGET